MVDLTEYTNEELCKALRYWKHCHLDEVEAEILRRMNHDPYMKPQTATTGVNAYFGTWPGDETEEELLALLEEP